MTIPSTKTTSAKLPNGIDVFYREAGPADGQVILILHGFPTSSFQYRNMMPVLAAAGYRVVVPDLPDFGFTSVPESLNYEHDFANMATTIESFLDVLELKKFVIYVNDYGAPTGYRIALNRPSDVLGIVTQNGNAYEEGLGDFWQPLQALWKANPGSTEAMDLEEKISASIFTLDTTKFQYVGGEPKPESIDPASWHLDWALMQRPGNTEIQMSLFRDYKTNVAMYSKFQEYFRDSNVPILAVWGKNDIIFIPPGAEAFKRDSKKVTVELWDGGHFIGESHAEQMADRIVEWLKVVGI